MYGCLDYLYLCTLCVSVSEEASIGCGMPWNESYRWLWETMWALRTQPEFSARAARSLNCWDIFPAPFCTNCSLHMCVCAWCACMCGMYTYGCVCLCFHACRSRCVCTCLLKSEVDTGYLPPLHSTLCIEAETLSELGVLRLRSLAYHFVPREHLSLPPACWNYGQAAIPTWLHLLGIEILSSCLHKYHGDLSETDAHRLIDLSSWSLESGTTWATLLE